MFSTTTSQNLNLAAVVWRKRKENKKNQLLWNQFVKFNMSAVFENKVSGVFKKQSNWKRAKKLLLRQYDDTFKCLKHTNCVIIIKAGTSIKYKSKISP